MISFTPEQLDFFESVKETNDNIALVAVAGSGKTTTLAEAMQRLYPSLGLAVAFNKKNAEDLRKRMPQAIQCKTFNGLGHGAWMKHLSYKDITLDDAKSRRLVSEVCRTFGFKKQWSDVKAIFDMARSNGFVPAEGKGMQASLSFRRTPDELQSFCEGFDIDLEHQEPAIYEAAKLALKNSIDEAFNGLIDFADQIYMPVCWNSEFKKFPLVLVDEAQDLNSFQHMMLERSLEFRGRIIAVGDPRQAIYGWRGAMSDSMNQLIEKFAMSTSNLSVNFRCGEKIIAQAQELVPEIQAHDGAWPGKVSSLREWTPQSIPAGSTILCRNNAPLVKLAFGFLKQGIGVEFAGRDFAKQISSLVRKVSGDQENLGIQDFIFKLDAWERTECESAKLRHRDDKIPSIRDRAESLRIIAASCGEAAVVQNIFAAIDKVFNSSGSRLLSTIHKAKGLEWSNVYILDVNLIPNRFIDPEDEDAIQQEYNLRYVAETRAAQTLTYIWSEQDNFEQIGETEEENEEVQNRQV